MNSDAKAAAVARHLDGHHGAVTEAEVRFCHPAADRDLRAGPVDHVTKTTSVGSRRQEEVATLATKTGRVAAKTDHLAAKTAIVFCEAKSYTYHASYSMSV